MKDHTAFNLVEGHLVCVRVCVCVCARVCVPCNYTL